VEREEMKNLLDAIIEAKYKQNTFLYREPIRPRPGPPATTNGLRQLDKHLEDLGLVAPSSYLMALSIYDGIEHFLGKGYSLLSVSEVIAGKQDFFPEDLEEFPDCCQFVIAAGKDPGFMGFDKSSSTSDGGYELVEVSPEGAEWRLKNFDDFLIEYLSVLKKSIEAEEKDRENLTDGDSPSEER
jgi:hypothetical protein